MLDVKKCSYDRETVEEIITSIIRGVTVFVQYSQERHGGGGQNVSTWTENELTEKWINGCESTT